MSRSENMISSDRQYLDWYVTKPDDVAQLLKYEKDNIYGRIWEPSCGMCHISNVLKQYGYDVFSSDIVDRGYNDATFDFLTTDMR